MYWISTPYQTYHYKYWLLQLWITNELGFGGSLFCGFGVRERTRLILCLARPASLWALFRPAWVSDPGPLNITE